VCCIISISAQEGSGAVSRTGKLLFSPGNILATPGALAAIADSPGDSLLDLLMRHLPGDWREMDEHDRRENELSLREGFRILSSYTLKSGVVVWVITKPLGKARFHRRRDELEKYPFRLE
jgi:hypothetical protein